MPLTILLSPMIFIKAGEAIALKSDSAPILLVVGLIMMVAGVVEYHIKKGTND